MLDGPRENLLRSLDGRELNGYSLELRDFKKGRTERESYFNLFLRRDGISSSIPVVQGLFFTGRGEFIKAWIEFRYAPMVKFPDGGTVDLEMEGLTSELFDLLGAMIPPGGSMMVIYGAERHPLSADTEKGLKRDFPPQATPFGYYLWNAGFRWFKDWYFPEGWMEGGMKLQATRPLDAEIRARREEKAARELREFIEKLEDGVRTPLEDEALSRAEDVLSSITAEVS
jgi:hypothetical protein